MVLKKIYERFFENSITIDQFVEEND